MSSAISAQPLLQTPPVQLAAARHRQYALRGKSEGDGDNAASMYFITASQHRVRAERAARCEVSQERYVTRGTIMRHAAYEYDLSLCSRVGNCACGVFGMICFCCLKIEAPHASWVVKPFSACIKGKSREERFFEDLDSSKELWRTELRKLGMEWDDLPGTCSDYIMSHQHLARSYYGHLCVNATLPQYGITGFLFLPNGEVSKVRFITVSNAMTGEPSTSSDLEAYVQKYCKDYRPG